MLSDFSCDSNKVSFKVFSALKSVLIFHFDMSFVRGQKMTPLRDLAADQCMYVGCLHAVPHRGGT